MLLTSCERVHKGGLWHGGDRVDQSRLRLGLANLRVGFSKLQADRLGQVGIEPHSLLQQNETWRRDSGALIGRDRSRDPDTGLWLVRRRDSGALLGGWGRGAESSLTINSIRETCTLLFRWSTLQKITLIACFERFNYNSLVSQNNPVCLIAKSFQWKHLWTWTLTTGFHKT